MNQVDETDINKLSDKTIIFGWVPSFVLKKKIKSSLPFLIDRKRGNSAQIVLMI